jgi:hypothetical protein
MRCLGTSQHLKNRYGNGYILEIKLKSLASETSGSASDTAVSATRLERKEKLTVFIRQLFRDALIQESFEDRLIFGLAQDSVVSLADTFNSLEGGKLHNFKFQTNGRANPMNELCSKGRALHRRIFAESDNAGTGVHSVRSRAGGRR